MSHRRAIGSSAMANDRKSAAEAFGKARTSRRIREASDRALASATRSGEIVADREFAMSRAQQEDLPVRDRSVPDAPGTSGYLPPTEIRAAAALVVAESGEMPREELIVATARLLGFVRVGAELRGMIEGTLSRFAWFLRTITEEHTRVCKPAGPSGQSKTKGGRSGAVTEAFTKPMMIV